MSHSSSTKVRRISLSLFWTSLLSLCLSVNLSTPSQAANRTWFFMPTGNGHGFQIFDRQLGRMTYFLEHPYRYVAPSGTSYPYPDLTVPGIERRNLAHDAYFGVSVNGQASWLNSLTNSVKYEEESNIIQASTQVGSVNLDTYYYSPFGYEGNAMVMLIRARSSQAAEVSFFAKPNLKFGYPAQGRTNPSDEDEEIQWNADEGYAIETGPGGGHALYVPLPSSKEGATFTGRCGRDDVIYNSVLDTQTLGEQSVCFGGTQVFTGQSSFSLGANEEVWWGMVVLYVNDNPNHPLASTFKDDRNSTEVLTAWKEFAQDQNAQQLHQFALDEWANWRVDKAPAQLSDEERKVWRQSEAVLRMGQIRENPQSNRYNYGMFLASLPIGNWHIGWVRDGVYAVASMAMNGHLEESRMGVEFFLNAEKGFFSEIGNEYRVSSCRYFGNGVEEADANYAGANLETDGWGLVLWGAAMYLQYSCDFEWLNKVTRHGDTVFEALYQIAQDIDNMIDPATGLPKPECSIWEVHWDLRQTFTYTAATQIRGLFDFVQIAYMMGEEEIAAEYYEKAQRMLEATRQYLVYEPLNSLASHRNVANQNVHVDGSTVEMLAWGMIEVDDPVFAGTLSLYDRLKTGFGGYRRLEPNLSLTGESGANTYDLSQWILLDLRIGEMWRKIGRADIADRLLDVITEGAVANDNLIPELFDPNQGFYEGVVPMVGYGAGAWPMTQLDKYGYSAPLYGANYEHCFMPPMPEGGQQTGGMDTSGGDMTGNTMMGATDNQGGQQNNPNNPNPMNPNPPNSMTPNNPGSGFTPPASNSENTDTYDWEAGEKASLCSAEGGSTVPSWWILTLFGLAFYSRKSRQNQKA